MIRKNCPGNRNVCFRSGSFKNKTSGTLVGIFFFQHVVSETKQFLKPKKILFGKIIWKKGNISNKASRNWKKSWNFWKAFWNQKISEMLSGTRKFLKCCLKPENFCNVVWKPEKLQNKVNHMCRTNLQPAFYSFHNYIWLNNLHERP